MRSSLFSLLGIARNATWRALGWVILVILRFLVSRAMARYGPLYLPDEQKEELPGRYFKRGSMVYEQQDVSDER